jgi:hypothetical protein
MCPLLTSEDSQRDQTISASALTDHLSERSSYQHISCQRDQAIGFFEENRQEWYAPFFGPSVSFDLFIATQSLVQYSPDNFLAGNYIV